MGKKDTGVGASGSRRGDLQIVILCRRGTTFRIRRGWSSLWRKDSRFVDLGVRGESLNACLSALLGAHHQQRMGMTGEGWLQDSNVCVTKARKNMEVWE